MRNTTSKLPNCLHFLALDKLQLKVLEFSGVVEHHYDMRIVHVPRQIQGDLKKSICFH